MSFSKAELERIESTLEAFLREKQPPAHIRSLLNYAYVISRQSIELHEVRPRWDNPAEKMTRPFAKATYVKSKDHWMIYWLRGNLKWHSYEPTPTVATVEDFLALVNADKHQCFFG
jgi:hypothetical protein